MAMTRIDPIVITEELARVRSSVRLMIWTGGLARVVAVLLGSLCAAGFVDWLIHVDDPGLRLLTAISIAVACGTILWRFLIVPLWEPLSGPLLAAQIERGYPELRGRLVSAVEFLDGQYPRAAGSPALQDAVVQDALRRLPEVDVFRILETRDLRRMAVISAAVGLTTLSAVILQPQAAATAMTRLLFPLADHPWPRRHDLQLVDANLDPVDPPLDQPLQIAQGEPLELYVQDRNGRLPDRVWLEVRDPESEEIRREPLRAVALRDPKERSVSVAAIALTIPSGSVEFRAIGGDDSTMPFRRVDVVPLPVIELLEVQVSPPPYSGRPPEMLPADVGHLAALVGSTIRAKVRVSKPLHSAELRWNDHEPVPLVLSDDQREFTAEFVLSEPGPNHYWFVLQDQQGFRNSDGLRYEARGIPDLVPDVAMEEPPGDVQVTAAAELPLTITADDDIGLARVTLQHQRDGSSEIAEISLVEDAAGSTEQRVDYVWKLADLQLQPGDRLQFRAAATDRYDLGEPHVGRSTPRQLLVVSQEQKQQEIVGRMSDLLDVLRETIQVQERSQSQLETVQQQLDRQGALRAQDRDQLQRAELDQRQVAAQLTRPRDGARERAVRLQDELAANGLDDPETRRRLEELEAQLDLLSREDLPAIEQDLTQSRKVAAAEELTPPSVAELTATLENARRQQQETVQTLQNLESLLSEWRDRRDVDSELASLKSDQQDLKGLATELSGRTLAQPLSELPAEDQADLKDLAERQRRMADRLDQFQRRLSQMAEKLATTEPATAETFENLKSGLQEQATAGRMREAAAAIAQNRMGQAGDRQQQVLSDLQSLEQVLRDQPPDDVELMVKQTEKVAEALAELQQKQAEVREHLQQEAAAGVGKPSAELKEEQAALVKQAQQLERQLERLQLQRPAETAERLRKQLEEAAAAAQQGPASDAEAAAMEQAQDLTEQARREVAAEQRQLAERLAQQQLETIASELASLQKLQEAAATETRRLSDEHAARGNWTRGQLRTLKDLADNQARLQSATVKLTEQLSAAEVFALTLRAAARLQEQAAAKLSERDAGPRTQAIQQQVLLRFQQLLAVIADQDAKPKQEPAAAGAESPPEDSAPEKAGPPGENLPQLAQLRLLRLLQESCLDRTSQLEARRGNDGLWTEELKVERDELAAEQVELADLAANLIARLLEGSRPRTEPSPAERGKDLE